METGQVTQRATKLESTIVAVTSRETAGAMRHDRISAFLPFELDCQYDALAVSRAIFGELLVHEPIKSP